MIQPLILNLNVIWSGFCMESKRIVRHNSFFFCSILFPLLNMMLVALYYQYSQKEQDILLAVIGSGLMGVWLASAFITAYNVLVERWSSTLELLIAAPSSLQLWILGRSLASTTLSLISMLVTLSCAYFVIHVKLTIKYPFLFVLMMLIIALTLTFLGSIISSLFVLTRAAEALIDVMVYPIYILSGLVFPISILPSWLQPLSFCMPLHWASVGLQATMQGDISTVIKSLFILLIMGVLLAILSTLCYRTIEKRVRNHATLALD